MFYASKKDIEDSKAPINHYYYIEVDPTNFLTEYHIMLTMDRMGNCGEGGRIELYNSPYPIVMLREKNSENIIGIMKPEDGEIYEIKDFHSLCYRKYVVRTTDFEIEKTQAMCMGQFHYFPYLSDATIVYGIEDVKKDES